MKKTYLQTGFTLIELLVVIAIIGILSSVVLASLNTARSKGSDAAVKGALAQMKSQAELYYDGAGNGTYGGTVDTGITASCTTGFLASGQQGASIYTNAIANANTTPSAVCYVGKNVWAISMITKGSGVWCVDNAGSAKSSTAQATGVCS